MIVMTSNCTGIRVGYTARRYEHAPARLGHLFSPRAQTGPHAFMPYALDNGAWGCFRRCEPFAEGPWIELLLWARSSGQRPLWALVPDAVGDRAETLSMWARYRDQAASIGAPLAFCAQDGMEPQDVPADAATVFLGGSTAWKWSSLEKWGGAFLGRLHVGRVNGLRQLRLCADAGAASCDGTGFGRTSRQWAELERFLSEQSGEVSRDAQTYLWSDDSAETMAHGSRSCETAAPAGTGGDP